MRFDDSVDVFWRYINGALSIGDEQNLYLRAVVKYRNIQPNWLSGVLIFVYDIANNTSKHSLYVTYPCNSWQMLPITQTHTPILTNSLDQTTRVHSTHNRTESPPPHHHRRRAARVLNTRCIIITRRLIVSPHQLQLGERGCVYHRAREWDNNCSEWQTRPDWSALTHACRTRICTWRRVRVYAGTNCDQINSYLYSSEHADMWASVLANMPIVTQGLFCVVVRS